MIQSIKEFREAAENFMARSRADREQDILSTLAKIRSDIKQLEEDLMPLGLVSGQTHETVKMRIDYMTKALLRGPDDDLPFDLSSLHHKLTNDINLIKAHCTQQRRNLVSGRRLLSLGTQPWIILRGWILIYNRRRWRRSSRNLQSSSTERSYESNTGRRGR